MKASKQIWLKKTKSGLSRIMEYYLSRRTKYIYVDTVHKVIFIDVYYGIGRMPSILFKQIELDYS